jgi:phosphoribosyl-ATP pyrophosphohydrolase/phosphoribosyl-AMP cyclohydrolase
MIDKLFHVIMDRKLNGDKNSYTVQLLEKKNKMLKKIIEEAGEVVIAMGESNEKEIVYEVADLTYHTLVGLAYFGIDPDKISQELKRRFGIGGLKEKESRKKG